MKPAATANQLPPHPTALSDQALTVRSWQESIPLNLLPSEAPLTPRATERSDQDTVELDCSAFSDLPFAHQPAKSGAVLNSYTTLSSTTSTLPITDTLPLTAENLRFFSGNMSPTISEQAASIGTMKSSSTMSMKIGRAVEIFRLNGLLYNDAAAKKAAHFEDLASDVCKTHRHSPARPPRGDALLITMTETAKVNEATMMNIWFHDLVHKDRMPNQAFKHAGSTDAEDDELMEGSESGPLLNPQAPAFQGFTQWREDGIYANWDKGFVKGSIPALEFIEKNELATLVKALPRVANPKPDVVYGYADKIFTPAQQVVNLLYERFAKISDGINWPFLSFDAKLDSMLAVRLQCMRSGSAIVAALRKLFLEAGVSDPNSDSWIFSVGITTALATIYVHWAETGSDSAVTYHTKPVKSFTLEYKDPHEDLRKAIANILDWGLLTRKPKVDEALDTLAKKHG
ncbi:MAG: hypothetical protein Q9210_007331 [Variospora velana]